MQLVDIQYDRNDVAFERGKFRVRGDCVEIWPSYEEYAFRIELWGDEVEKLSIINPISGETLADRGAALHLSGQALRDAGGADRQGDRHDQAGARRAAARCCAKPGKLLEAQRLSARTRFDIEMLMETGHCPGIENYSRPLSGRPPGSTPDTLHDFFPDDFLMIVDESHVTVPQIRAMYNGDQARKDDARRARLSAAQRAGQPAAEVRRVGEEDRPGRVRVARRPSDYELRQDRRRSRRADHPADGPARSGDRSLARPAARCRTCWSRFASGPRSASACW